MDLNMNPPKKKLIDATNVVSLLNGQYFVTSKVDMGRVLSMRIASEEGL
jgi:hypothetical protein